MYVKINTELQIIYNCKNYLKNQTAIYTNLLKT